MRKPEGDIENSEVVSRKDFERLASQIDSASESAKYARSLAEKILTKEAWQLGLVTLIIAAAAGISGYSVYDKSVEVTASAERAEGLVREALGKAKPNNVSTLSPVSIDASGGSRLSYMIEPNFWEDESSYALTIFGNFSGLISGQPANLIGVEFKIEGALAELVARDPYGNLLQATLDSQTRSAKYSAIEAVPLAENGRFSFSVSFKRNFLSCLAAEKAISTFIENESSAFGVLWVRPVFERINEAPTLLPFKVTAFERDGLKCEYWDDFFEKSANSP
jgi:hypothetical protein